MSAGANNVPVILRAATPQDRFRIRRWLAEPAIEAGWGNAASAEAEINLAMDSDAAICRIVMCEGVPVGYAHALDIGLLGDEPPSGLAAGTWHVNWLIASAQQGGGAVGSAVVALLVDEVFATTLAVGCAAVVAIRNEAAVRSCERAGFRWRRIWDDRLLGPSWLLLKDRPT